MNIHCSACGAPLVAGGKLCPPSALPVTAIAMPTPRPSRQRTSLLALCVTASLLGCMVETTVLLGQEKNHAAASQPFGLKGDRLGETLAEFRAANDHVIQSQTIKGLEGLPIKTRHMPECTHDPVPENSFLPTEIDEATETDDEQRAGVVKCIVALNGTDDPDFYDEQTIAGVRANQTIYYFFRDRLYKIDSDLPREFGTLREAFVSKYGPPTSSEIVQYQNGFGARFSGRRLFWRNPLSTISMGELDGEGNGVEILFRDKALGKECETAGRVKDRGKDM